MITLEDLRAELAAGDAATADVQQRYMKSAMPSHGVPAPELRGYVDSLGDRLSGLSHREATKHL